MPSKEILGGLAAWLKNKHKALDSNPSTTKINK
jgi:hypothetical protein